MILILKKILLIGFVCVTCSCNIVNNHKKKILSDNYIGNEILLSSLVFFNNSTEVNLDSLTYSRYKVVIYVDSSNCDDCRISQALAIRGYELEIIRKKKYIPFIYIFNTQDAFSLKEHLEYYGFRSYYFVDLEDTFLSANNITHDKRFHTFLLENNKIKVIGNPSISSDARRRYNNALKI